MNIVLISIDGLGLGNTQDNKKKSNTWKTILDNSKRDDFPFLRKIINNSSRLFLDYKGADSFLGHLTMSGIKTNKLSLKPYSESKKQIINLLKKYNLSSYEHKGTLVVEDKLIIYDNFEADYGLAVNVAGCADEIDFELQLKISKDLRKIIKNPRLISFTANDININDYKKYTVQKNGYFGIETPKSGVYNKTFKVKHFPAKVSFENSIQKTALNLKYKTFLYGKFSNIININEKKLKKYNDIDIDKTFNNLYKNVSKKTFHCINIQQTDLSGHEGNVKKYIKALNKIDFHLKKISLMKDIIYIISSDHGNDPSIKDGLHTREYVPFYSNYKKFKNVKKLSDVSKFIENLFVKKVNSKIKTSSYTKEKIYRHTFNNDFGWDGHVDVYLSKNISYSEKTKVIYAHDAHSLFASRETRNGQSWDMENTLKEKEIDAIVISSVTEGHIRPDLLSPHKNSKLTKKAGYRLERKEFGGKGKVYAKFFIEKIIPQMLKKYNVPLKNKKYIVGASMGGYMNTYILANYPNQFESFAIFSPAYWFNHDIFLIEAPKIKNLTKKIYIDIGKKEGNKEIQPYYLNDAIKMHKIIKAQNPSSNIKFIIEKDALHEEDAWAKRFKKMIKWFLN